MDFWQRPKSDLSAKVRTTAYLEAKVERDANDGSAVKWLLEEACTDILSDTLESGTHHTHPREVLVLTHSLEQVANVVENLAEVRWTHDSFVMSVRSFATLSVVVTVALRLNGSCVVHRGFAYEYVLMVIETVGAVMEVIMVIISLCSLGELSQTGG